MEIESFDKVINNYQKAMKSKDLLKIRPKNWGGYIVKPFEFEFWQGRPDRLHQRVLFSFDKNKKWKFNILSP